MKYLLFTFLLFSTLFSKEIKNITVESSSAIVNSTAEEAKNLALRRARSMIIENANGVTVVSNVLVKDGALAAEYIKNYSRGIILNEKIEWLPITQFQKDKNSPPIPEYNVKITADVLIKEKENNLVINSSINKTVYSDNEKMNINLLSSEDVDIAIFFLGYDDKIYKLIPTLEERISLEKNKEIVIPRRGKDNFDLEVIVPEKMKNVTEAIWIIAAKTKEKIPFHVYFNKDIYSLNEFFSIYSEISTKCNETILPYHVYKEN